MAATSRLGMLLLLAACGGGGDRAGRTDTTGTATVPPAEQPTTGAADTSMTAGASDTSMAPVASSAAESASAMTRKADTTKKARSTSTPKPSASAAAGAQDTGKKAAAAAAGAQDTGKKAAAAGGGGPMSPQLIALGDSIFHGQVAGGTCTACHGQDAKGTAVAPDLTDNQWLNGDGSYQFIVNTVTNGVPKPKQHPAPMPPKGGAPLNDDQVKAVAAYVYSLSHKT
jgi:mono/diheme cytochrome c family protein